MVKEKIPEPKSKFLKVKCLDCGSEQIVFGCAATEVKCETCGRVIAEPTGGKTRFKTKIVTVL
ncbi:MAG: 30S ribosomal protein S27e [Candidatus Odinarchaeota archaeon]